MGKLNEIINLRNVVVFLMSINIFGAILEMIKHGFVYSQLTIIALSIVVLIYEFREDMKRW